MSSPPASSLAPPKEHKKEKKDSHKERASDGKKKKKDKKEKKRRIQDFYAFPNVELGRGAFSIVHLATDKATGEEVAVKVICKKDLGSDYQKNLEREIEILRRIKHPHIIALKDLFETKHEMYIVMELVQGGELFDKIVEKGSYSEAEAAELVRAVLSAIAYLHENDVVHRDLKPENLLLRSKDDATEVCIADFGLSKIVGKATMMATACMPEEHEILTERGFMDLSAYEAAAARGDAPRVAGYDRAAQQVVFETPLRHVVCERATRTLVELSASTASPDARGVHFMVTRDHELFAQPGSAAAAPDGAMAFKPRHISKRLMTTAGGGSKAQSRPADFAKVRAGALVDARDDAHAAVRQLTCAANGVQRSAKECEHALAPISAALSLETAAQQTRFLEVYGALLARGVARGDSCSADGATGGDAAWLGKSLDALGVAWRRDDSRGVAIVDARWLASVGADVQRCADWIWTLGAEQLRAVVRGLQRSADRDGALLAASAAARDELVRVLMLAGYSAHFEARADARGWSVSASRADDALGAPVLYKARDELRERQYTGRVWCFTMPSGFVWTRSAHKDAASGAVRDASRAVLVSNCGTPSYVAPEVLNATGYGAEVDLWSVGVITYILLCGFPPFYGETVPDIFDQILAAKYDYPEEYWGSVSDAAKAFIDALLVIDVKERLTAKQALEHPWLADAAAAKAETTIAVGKQLGKQQSKRRDEAKLCARSFSFAGDTPTIAE